MNKNIIYKGYELVKMIHDNIDLDDGTRIEVHDERLNPSLVTVLEYNNYRLNWKEGSFNTRALFDDYYYFRVLEDNTEEQETLGESWKEMGKRVGEWAKEFQKGFTESFSDIILGNKEDNTEEIGELDEWITRRDGEVTQQEGKRLEMCYKINELVRVINQLRKDLNK